MKNFYRVASFSDFAKKENDQFNGNIKNLRNWEHIKGHWYIAQYIITKAGIKQKDKFTILGLGVGKETVNHFMASNFYPKKQRLILSDNWGMRGWFESSPIILKDKDTLWKHSETHLFKSEWEDFKNVEVQTIDFSNVLPFVDNSVNLVYSFSSIEHVNQDDKGTLDEIGVIKVISEIRRILVPGGFCLLTLPFDVFGYRFGTLTDWQSRIGFAGFEMYIDDIPFPKDLITADTNYVQGGKHSSVVFGLYKRG